MGGLKIGGLKIDMPKISTPSATKIFGNKIGGAIDSTDLLGIHKDIRNASVFHSLFNNGAKGPDAPNPGEDPKVTALRQKLYGDAIDFDNSLPGLQSSAQKQIEREGGQALKSGVKGTRENFNRRGLLYSGLREGGEQDVRGRVASGMASQTAESNADLNKMAKSKYETAANVGLQNYQDQVKREAEIADINMRNQVSRAQAMQQLGNTVGYGAGAYYGSNQNQYGPQVVGGNMPRTV